MSMRILILGADGMLGHQLVQTFRERHDVAGTVRGLRATYARVAHALPDMLFDGVDAKDFGGIAAAIDRFSPEAVVNAVGIVKQRDEARNAIESIEVNSLLPHRLADYCSSRDTRLVHMSTDCVFSGKHGNYMDEDVPDASDLYGRSKLLGEVAGEGVITLRTSIIGLELSRKASLVEWFLQQSGSIRGFRKAIYSGLTTLEMARIIERLLVENHPLRGVFNVSSDPIDKFGLLSELRDRLGKSVEIVPDDDFECDRSLNSDRFRSQFNYVPPQWTDMLDELATAVQARDGGDVIRTSPRALA